MYVSHRFHERAAADKVLIQARQLINIKLDLERIPNTETRTPKAGDWAIVTYDTCVGYRDHSQVDAAVNAGILLALADALRKYNPHHELLRIWHLIPGNHAHFAVGGSSL